MTWGAAGKGSWARRVVQAVLGLGVALFFAEKKLLWYLYMKPVLAAGLIALIDGITPAETTFWKGLVAGSANLAIGLVSAPDAATWLTTGAALLVGAVCYGVSIVLYIIAAQKLGGTRGQMFFSTAPFFGLALSVLILAEEIRPIQLAAAGLIVVSLAILFIGRHAHLHVHRAKKHEHWHQHDDGHHAHGHPGDIKDLGHVHEHEHEESAHAHPHLPDIHHRHGHGD